MELLYCLRHAMGDKKLLKGSRLGMMGLWFAGLALLIPFCAVAVLTLGDFAGTVISALKNMQMPSLSLNAQQAAMLLGGAVVLLFPVVPLKNLLPAVYLRKVKEARDAQA